jgi:hypothetical protein
MRDRSQSTRPVPEPAAVPNAESDHPLRQVFARRLDGESLDRFTAELVELYDQRLESGEGVARGCELESGLRAVAGDLRLCAGYLRERSADPDHSSAQPGDRAWCLLAGARAVEAEAVAERIERMLSHPHTAACPFPPGIEAAGIAPEVRP